MDSNSSSMSMIRMSLVTIRDIEFLINRTDFFGHEISEISNYSCSQGSSLLDMPSVRVAMTVAYIVVFCCCFFGNILILVVIVAHKRMRTSTNFFLANLAIADLFVGIFCVVQNYLQLFAFGYGSWQLGAMLCHLYLFTLQLGPCASSTILVLLSIERYIVVHYPIKASRYLTKLNLGLATGIGWLASILFSWPFFSTAKLYSFGSSNHTGFPIEACGRGEAQIISYKMLILMSFVTWYVVPLASMVWIYSRIGGALWRSARAAGITFDQPAILGAERSALTCSLTASPNVRFKQKREGTTSDMADNSSMDQNLSQMISVMKNGDSPRSNRTAKIRHVVFVDCPATSVSGTPKHLPDVKYGSRLVQPDRKFLFSPEDQADADSSTLSSRSLLARNQPTPDPPASDDVTVESRRKVIRLLVIIIAVFAVLTLPHYVRQLWLHWYTLSPPCNSSISTLYQPLAYISLFMNSGINPFFYAFLSAKFRSALRDLLLCQNTRETERNRVIEGLKGSRNAAAAVNNTSIMNESDFM